MSVIVGEVSLSMTHNVGALRRRLPEPVTPWRQLNKDTKAGHLFCRSSVIRQLGGGLDLKTTLDFTRQPLAQNPLLAAVLVNTKIISKRFFDTYFLIVNTYFVNCYSHYGNINFIL